MCLLFFLLWLIFNGRVTLEIIIFGLVISALMYAFICKFMDYNIYKDIMLLKKSRYIVQYIGILLFEIVKANISVIRLIISSKYIIEPVMVSFHTTLKSRTARVVLANSITLTPGTITVSVEEDKMIIHCLDQEFGQGLSGSVFEQLLEKIERTDG